jgi:hypothetical protein
VVSLTNQSGTSGGIYKSLRYETLRIKQIRASRIFKKLILLQDRAVYTCDEGYQIVGLAKVVCQGGAASYESVPMNHQPSFSHILGPSIFLHQIENDPQKVFVPSNRMP